MGYRRLMIENPVQVSIKNEQHEIQTDAAYTFPLEDIDAVLFESRQTKLSVATLSGLAERGCAVFFCDEKHLPCCVLTPFMQHSRQLGVIRQQLALTEPQKKRLWQQLVIRKILNQSLCLRQTGAVDAADSMVGMSKGVLSGDSGNVEATAAAYYFPRLFDAHFYRGNENDGRNAALNYGYAILRGSIARTLAVYGFTPSLGLHHRSELNAFNLADDLIEPFRPLIDGYVWESVWPDDELSPQTKRALFDLMSMEMRYDGKRYSVTYAIERTVQSLLRCMKDAREQFLLPEYIPLKRHRYE